MIVFLDDNIIVMNDFERTPQVLILLGTGNINPES